MGSTNQITDEELRALRNKIYPATKDSHVQSDESWEHVKANWRRDAQWLVEQCEKSAVRSP